jgi:4-amino-4-deoxy-L-arabinose transferase-like glycosyltransferase
LAGAALPQTDGDVAMYGAAAKQILASGDWIALRHPASVVDVPPVTIWIMALSLRLGGDHPWVLRFWHLIVALGIVAVTYKIARMDLGEETAHLAALLLVTTGEFLIWSAAPKQDIPLVLCVSLALYQYLCYRREPGRVGALLIGLWLAVAMLTKGLIGPLLILFIISLDLVAGRSGVHRISRSQAVRDVLWAGGVFLLVAAPWYIANTVREGTPFLELHFLGGSTVWRYVTEGLRSQDRLVALLAFGPLLVLGCIPWTPLLPATIRAAWTDWRAIGPGVRLCAIWAAGGFAALSLQPGVREIRYLLPLYPPLAILMARMLSGVATSLRVPRSIGWVAVGLGVVGVATQTIARSLVPPPQPFSPSQLILPGAGPALIIFGALTLIGRLRVAVATIAAAVIVAYGSYVWTLNQRWDQYWPWARISASILERHRPGDRIVIVGNHTLDLLIYHLNGLTADSMSEERLVREWTGGGLFAVVAPEVYARVAPRLRPTVLVRAGSGWVLVSNR